MPDIIKFHKTQAGLVDVDFKAWNIQIHGLHGMRIKNLHVLRQVISTNFPTLIQVHVQAYWTERPEGSGPGGGLG